VGGFVGFVGFAIINRFNLLAVSVDACLIGSLTCRLHFSNVRGHLPLMFADH
jgi:hypothetical protein